jgi:hypothetical protein
MLTAIEEEEKLVRMCSQLASDAYSAWHKSIKELDEQL